MNVKILLFLLIVPFSYLNGQKIAQQPYGDKRTINTKSTQEINP